jgi:hypothetical protein
MLISNQKFADGDIVSFKLVNGDEIVAKIIEETDGFYRISSPCTVVPSPQGLGLIQSLFSANEKATVTLSKSHVMFCAESLEQMKSHYLKTTTGIDIIPKQGIIT